MIPSGAAVRPRAPEGAEDSHPRVQRGAITALCGARRWPRRGERVRQRKWICFWLGVDRTTLWRAVRAGRFPGPDRVIDGRVGWSENALHDWENNQPLTLIAVASRLRIHRSTLWRWIKRGWFPAADRKFGARPAWSEEAISDGERARFDRRRASILARAEHTRLADSELDEALAQARQRVVEFDAHRRDWDARIEERRREIEAAMRAYYAGRPRAV